MKLLHFIGLIEIVLACALFVNCVSPSDKAIFKFGKGGHENSIFLNGIRGGESLSSNMEDATTKQEQREQLYEAYNMLHSLAQGFQKPFDSPAVLVIGHQTSGKSALIEALMGFQFNQVGGGTKTRRPIALRMQYNPECDTPKCHLTLDDGQEEPRSLDEIQAYIESENRRLEKDPSRSFDSREIEIRIEYRFCPNMILIDTPGLIQAPKGKNLNLQQQAILKAAREAERIVLEKMRKEEYIILCVEDTTDWKHATTRNVVMQADPSLERTVLVCTKFDTKLPQFGANEDLVDFVEAPVLGKLFTSLLGGPFFTSVPSGRVGRNRDSAFYNNDAFVAAVKDAEAEDLLQLSMKIRQEKYASQIGISQLRRFLEIRVEECYRKNVARIVPLLQRELTKAESRLLSTEREISALSLDQLKAGAEDYREHFVRALENAIHGTIQAPPDRFGETLEQEQQQAGSFVESGRIDGTKWDRLMEVEIGSINHKLYGGAQYHRVLREFAFSVRHMSSPDISDDEIANAGGLGDMHDGVNFMRAACVIAVEKARLGFDPVLESLRVRVVHVMKRLFSVVEYMLKREGLALSDSHQKPFSLIIRRIYENFIEASVDDCLARSRDDLKALTRFVMWDLHEKSSHSLHRSLPDANSIQIYSLAVEQRGNSIGRRKSPENVIDQWEAANTAGLGGMGQLTDQREYLDLVQLMEDAACSRTNCQRTGVVVSALVRHIMSSWRDHFSRNVSMKFNCFFLMPFIDSFPFYLRSELEKIYSGNVEDLFDISQAKGALIQRRDELISECKACHQIQGKFDMINAQLNAAPAIYSPAVDVDIRANSFGPE